MTTADSAISEDDTLSEAEYRQLAASETEGIVLLSVDEGRILEINSLLEDVLLYPRDELLGKRFWELGGLLMPKANIEAFRRLQRLGHLRSGELPLMTEDRIRLAFEFQIFGKLADGRTVLRCLFKRFVTGGADEATEPGEGSLAQFNRTVLRRQFLSQAHGEAERAKRYGRRLALMSIEIDRLRGAAERDRRVTDLALKNFATACSAGLRACDSLTRVGEASFVALLPETDTKGALAAAERLRTAVAAMQVPTKEGRSRKITLSIGIAASRSGLSSYEALRSRADGKLEAARDCGGNRICA